MDVKKTIFLVDLGNLTHSFSFDCLVHRT